MTPNSSKCSDHLFAPKQIEQSNNIQRYKRSLSGFKSFHVQNIQNRRHWKTGSDTTKRSMMILPTQSFFKSNRQISKLPTGDLNSNVKNLSEYLMQCDSVAQLKPAVFDKIHFFCQIFWSYKQFFLTKIKVKEPKNNIRQIEWFVCECATYIGSNFFIGQQLFVFVVAELVIGLYISYNIRRSDE